MNLRPERLTGHVRKTSPICRPMRKRASRMTNSLRVRHGILSGRASRNILQTYCRRLLIRSGVELVPDRSRSLVHPRDNHSRNHRPQRSRVLSILTVFVMGLWRCVKMVSRVVFTVVSVPSAQPRLTVLIFDVRNVEVPVRVRLHLDVCVRDGRSRVVLPFEGDDSRVRSIRRKHRRTRDPRFGCQ